MATPNLLDIAKINGSDGVVGLIDEASKPHPEILLLPTRPIKGLNFTTLVRTSVPTGNPFRDANDGIDAVKSTYENRLVGTFIANPRWECDKAVADAHEDGAEAYIALEASGIMEGTMQAFCTQIYYGSHAGGFPGWKDVVQAAMEVNAGGSTAKTSVWAVRFGFQHANLVVGNNGSFAMDDPRIETITGQNGKKLTGYVQEMLARLGSHVGSVYSLARIKNVGTDAGKGLTDDLLYELLATFPEGTQPDAIFMNGRSREQLRKSRTAVNASGQPAPIPSSITGDGGEIPIYPTSALTNAEA